MRIAPLIGAIILFGGAALIAGLPGSRPDDAPGAAILAALLYVLGVVLLLINLVVLWIDRRKRRSISKFRLIVSGVALACYLSPLGAMAWDSYVRERVFVSYNLEFSVPEEIARKDWEFEVTGYGGSMAGPLQMADPIDKARVLQSAASGVGRRQFISIRDRTGGEPAWVFFIDLSQVKAPGFRSQWLQADSTNQDEGFLFIKKAVNPPGRTAGKNEPSLRYTIQSFEVKRGT